MKMTDLELKEYTDKMAEQILASKGLATAIRKVSASYGDGNPDPNRMSKEEKTMKFFKAQMDGDIATVKALSGATDGAGGYLLPTEFMEDVIDRIVKDPIALRSLCTTVPITARTGWFPVGKTGVVVDWEGNDSPFSETTPTFDQLQFTVNRLAGFTAISKDLMSDTPVNLYNFLTKQYAKAFVKAENLAIIGGSGVAQPTGIRTNADVASVAVTGTTGSKLLADDIVGLPFSLDINYREGGVYIMNSKVVKMCRLMKDSQGRYLFVDGDITKGLPPTFNGYRVIELAAGIPENLGTGTNETEVIFGNLENYYIFDKHEMGSEINTQSDTAFKNNQALIKMWERLDGNVAIPGGFVRLKGIVVA